MMPDWPADYHLHTPLCRHASGEPWELAARAQALGFAEIGFSDHCPLWRDDFDTWRMRLDQLELYLENVGRARRDHPALQIKLALEVDYLPGHEDWVRDLARRAQWDYFIGSVHYVAEGWAIDDPSRVGEWQRRDPYEIWAEYFDRLIRAAETRLFDIIGHCDLPKKFGIRPQRDVTPLVRRFIESAQTAGVCVELNTAGLRKECREIYPSIGVVRELFAHRIPITFASDAHAVEEVGADFADAVRLAQAAGYRQWTRFSQRRREAVALA